MSKPPMKRPPCGGLFALSLSQLNDTAKGLCSAILPTPAIQRPGTAPVPAPHAVGQVRGLMPDAALQSRGDLFYPAAAARSSRSRTPSQSGVSGGVSIQDRKSTRLNSSHLVISY